MWISSVTTCALLIATVICRVAPPFPRQHTATNVTTLIKISNTTRTAPSGLEGSQPALGADSPPPAKRPKLGPGSPATTPQSDWDKYVCRGERLTQASKLEKDQAGVIAVPIDTQWSGNLQAERKLWGYFDSSDADCDFEGSYYDITRALEALNVEDGECFRTSHYDPDKDGEIKDQTYKVDDKDYRATGAHATFGINVEEGAMFFIDVASAPRKAAQLWSVDSVPKDQLPALSQISDIAWGFWHEAHGGSDLGHITKFIVPQIINEITVRLVDEALKKYNVPDGEHRQDSVPEWPGITFEIGTPEGQVLLGSPVGIAAAYFLSQHKQEIGTNKYVSKVTVFRPDEDSGQDEPTIVYIVEDAPVPSQEEEDPDQTSTENRDLGQKHARRDLVLAAEETDLWDDCVCRGEKLTVACMADKEYTAPNVAPIESPWKGTLETELKLWGYRDQPAMSHCSFGDIEEALKALKISRKSKPEGGLNYCYEVRHSYQEDTKGPDGKVISQKDQTYAVEGKTYRMTSAHAIIGANTVSGVIFLIDVRSAYHGAEELWYPEVPTAETLPKLRAISDISWAFWNRAWMNREEKRRKLGNINYFVVHNIVNQQTEQLIKRTLQIYESPEGQQGLSELPQWPGLTFDVISEAGKALLGEIGANKYVYQVQIFASEWGSGPSMILHVKDAPTPTSDDAEPSKETKRSKHFIARALQSAVNSSTPEPPLTSGGVVSAAGRKKLDDDTLWNLCKCRGEKITQASLQNKDIAMTFVTPIDSPWEGGMEAELKLWGYKEPDDFSMYCDFGNVAAPLKDMGVDTKFKEKTKDGQNECYQAHHSRGGPMGKIREQTYVVGDKTYRMTNAIMQIGVNARDGMITFFNIRSATQAATITWGVDEPDAADLPELNRVSDISWAFWKRAHKDDTGLGNIQKFLVHDAVNSDTLRLVKMALKTYQVPHGDKRRKLLPKWPGLVFSIESDEGKVMLGSPNGIAAGYFLVQHKTQLGGNKYIYQVTLWNDSDGDVQMVFWVRDAPPQNTLEEGGNRKRSTVGKVGFSHAFKASKL